MSESRRQLLTIGVFFIIIVVAILLYPANVTRNWLNILHNHRSVRSMDAGSGRSWSQGPQKYERSPYSTVQMGVLLMALGGAWFRLAYNWLYSIALLLLALGAIAIASAMRRKKP